MTSNVQASDAVLKPKLLDQLKRCIRDKYYSLRIEEAYVYWARWFIRFHGLRHPAEMGVLNRGGRGVISPLEKVIG